MSSALLSPSPIAKVSGLRFEYPGVRALDDVSFSLERGTVTALVGPNGAGKSTLLRCVAGLETPALGEIEVAQIDVLESPRNRDYPLPPLQVDQAGSNFEAATKKLGYHPFSTPRAILSQPYKGRPGCSYCGACQGFGCHIGAKSSILVTALPGRGCLR